MVWSLYINYIIDGAHNQVISKWDRGYSAEAYSLAYVGRYLCIEFGLYA